MANTFMNARLQVVGRVAAGVVGGWFFAWGFVVLGITLLSAAGMGYGDAQMLAFLLAFLLYLTVFLWSFAAASLARVGLVLVGGGALMTALAWLMSRQA